MGHFKVFSVLQIIRWSYCTSFVRHAAGLPSGSARSRDSSPPRVLSRTFLSLGPIGPHVARVPRQVGGAGPDKNLVHRWHRPLLPSPIGASRASSVLSPV